MCPGVQEVVPPEVRPSFSGSSPKSTMRMVFSFLGSQKAGQTGSENLQSNLWIRVIASGSTPQKERVPPWKLMQMPSLRKGLAVSNVSESLCQAVNSFPFQWRLQEKLFPEMQLLRSSPFRSMPLQVRPTQVPAPEIATSKQYLFRYRLCWESTCRQCTKRLGSSG